MIKTFSKRNKMLFIPVNWLNSVANWLTGLHSPTGTIKIGNTASPSEGKGPSIDVDVNALAKLITPIVADRLARNSQALPPDGTTIISVGGRLQVSKDWIQRCLDNLTVVA